MALSAPYRKTLPWWTWVAPLPIFFLGTVMSLEAKITTGTALFYFPIPFALTLTYWWGLRVLPAFYLNAVCCAGLWGLDRMALWPIYGLPEVIFVLLSWFFFVKIFSGKVCLPNTRQVVSFLLIGILVPLVPYKFILESVFYLAGDTPSDNYWNLFITTGFGDFISTFCVSIPFLYFFTKLMARHGWLLDEEQKEDIPLDEIKGSRQQWVELICAGIAAYLVNRFLGFTDYWFLNGILSLYIAMRFGFGPTIMLNSYILLITYVIPAATYDDFLPGHFLASNMLKTQLGTALLYVFSIIIGRLVSDMRFSELQLSDQNKKLNVINTELDRFVYSVSHDLSAPLKSILGLVNISRLTDHLSDHRIHFNLIEKSVRKLEAFVSEVLDYSQNKRLEIALEQVNLKELWEEVVKDLQYIDGVNEINIHHDTIEPEIIVSDRRRLKIILQNLFSNAVKFRRQNEASFVKFYTGYNHSQLTLFIEDNGEGIRPELQSKIFDMFFRATESSNGSGLGLYIAMEAAKTLGAQITVRSEYGKGSVFGIVFSAPEHQAHASV
ncbi:MAG TPA: HAMP domain-containing sensor histidine kinase [Ohtaekwangia sp.]|uniref:sensor histidine kinase n=1 Tax=Ohtaekwangia sp. TaxID=2066019 RepID=UPI002F95FAB3